MSAGLAPGLRLGDYVLEAPLGAGGMGAVWVARHADLDQRVAVKVAQPTPLPAHRRERFLREAAALARVDRHPGIVRIHGYGHDEESSATYMVLELIEGEDLTGLFERGPAPVDRVLRIGEGLARALAHVHAQGITHRDVKLGNVVLRADGSPVLIDFGLALAEDSERLTRTGGVVGTPRFMAPEQIAANRAAIGPPCDVFALCAVLYTLASDRYPFEGDDLVNVMAATTRAKPLPPSRHAQGVPRDLDALILSGLSKAPDDRPSALELADGLARIGRGERAVEPAPWRRALIAGLVVLLLIVGLGLLGVVSAERNQTRESLEAEASWQQEALVALAAGDTWPLDEAVGRESALGSLVKGLDPEDPEVRKLVYVAARLRALARHEPAPARPAGVKTEHLLLDAIELRSAGDLAGAARRVERMLASEPAHPAGQRLRVELLCSTDPLALIAAAADGDSAARAALERNLHDVLDRLHPEAAVDVEAAEGLARIQAALGEGVPLREQRAAQAAAMEGAAGYWDQACRAAAREGSIDSLIDRLVELARLTAERPSLGPQVKRVLAGVVGAVCVRGDRESQRKAVGYELRLFYEAGGIGEIPGYSDLLTDHTHIRRGVDMDAETRFQLALASLRCDPMQVSRSLGAAAPRSRWESFVREHPESRAGRFGLAITALESDAGHLAAREELLAARNAPLADLHPKHQGNLHKEVASAQLMLRRPEAARLGLREIELAKPLLRAFPSAYADAVILEGRLLQLEDPQRAVNAWPRLLEELRQLAKVKQPSLEKGSFLAGFQALDARQMMAEANIEYASSLEALGRPDEALKITSVALESIAEGTEHGLRSRCYARRMRIARLRGDTAEQTRWYQLYAEEALNGPELTVEIAHVLRARGQVGQARELLKRQLSAGLADDSDVRALLDEIGR